MLARVYKAYHEAVLDTDRTLAVGAITTALAQGVPAEDLVFRVVVPSLEATMAAVARDPDANLAQHFMTAQIAGEVTDLLLSRFAKPPDPVGRVIIGTARGDLHSLGKRIVSGCLKALLVDVVDVGVNVPAERFVDEAVARDAHVIAVSAMMLHTATGETGARQVRALLGQRGLNGQVKLIVGGAPYRFDPELYKAVGADASAPDGVSAGRLITELIERVKAS